MCIWTPRRRAKIRISSRSRAITLPVLAFARDDSETGNVVHEIISGKLLEDLRGKGMIYLSTYSLI